MKPYDGLVLRCIELGFEVNYACSLTFDTNLVLPLIWRHRAIIIRLCGLWDH